MGAQQYLGVVEAGGFLLFGGECVPLRLCGSTQLLLYRVQLGFGGLQGGAGFFQRCRLPGSQGIQQGQRRSRYRPGAPGPSRASCKTSTLTARMRW